ncbi:hypothetical protein Q1695_007492 [Nippostrongylus brasiliensis]|nr:hypothetical protein Q1695_007492 [Nippostrongylus brasiliensis]
MSAGRSTKLVRNCGQENVTIIVSPAANTTVNSDSYDIFGTLKGIVRWSLVCEEVSQREQKRMEQIVGPIGHDPTAPSDLNTVTETLWFDSATIVAALIVTFFVFYFIDFFMQLFGRVSTMMSADPTPSVASLQPVIPTRTRRRRRTGTSMSRETTPNYTSVHWPSDSTQASLTPSPAQPMMDIVTKSIRPNFSREICVPPNNPPPAKVNPDIPSPKVDSATLKLSSERKLAGRSPTNHYATPEHWKNADTVHMDTKEQVMNSGDHVYDENHGLPYADDISGEEFDSCRYEHSQACTVCTKQLDDLRTEFSIDDVSNSDDIREEWEDEDEEHRHAQHHVDVSREMQRSILPDQIDDEKDDHISMDANKGEIFVGESRTAVVTVLQNTTSEELSVESVRTKLLSSGEEINSAEVSPLREVIITPPTDFRGDTPLDYMEHCDEEGDSQWEEPRSLDLSNDGFVQHCESLLSGADESLHLEDGDNTERSISSFDITQSIETRHYHHVLFTYPDPTPYKVLLTGSFFGWKMSLPMQREGDAFRLSITLPAGRHQYRFQVHRRPSDHHEIPPP